VLDRLSFDPRLRQLLEDRLASLVDGDLDEALGDLLGRAEIDVGAEPHGPQTDDFERVVEKMSPEDLQVLLRGLIENLDLPSALQRDYGEMVGRVLRRTTLKAQSPNIRRAMEDLRRLMSLSGEVSMVVRDARSILGDAAAASCAELVAMSEVATRDLRFARVSADLSMTGETSFYDGLHFRICVGSRPLGHGGVMAGLLEAMGSPEPVPSVGIALDVGAISAEIDPEALPVLRALVVPVAREDLAPALELTRGLRAEGVAVEMDVMERSIKQNINYAVRREIPFLVIIGEEERLRGRVAVKNLATKEQTEVLLDDPAALARVLGAGA